MRRWATASLAMMAGPGLAATPATVQMSAAPAHAAAAFRLPTVIVPENPTFRVDDPRSMLRSGYGGAMVDLFPFEGGRFHFSAGPRLFGRGGRIHALTPENQLLLPAFRGPRYTRRFSPALLVGYGRPVEAGLSLGVDVGMVMGRIAATPDRIGRLNRARADMAIERGGGRRGGGNQIARVTALYRF